jgi:hypothetical protein
MSSERYDPSVLDEAKGAGTSPSGAGNKITVEGHFRIRVNKVAIQDSRNPKTRGAILLIVEYTVLESSVPELVPVNAKRSWTNDLTRQFGEEKTGLKNGNMFLAAASGMQPGTDEADAEIDRSYYEDAEKGALNGVEVFLDTQPRKGDSGFPWTYHSWSPVAE